MHCNAKKGNKYILFYSILFYSILFYSILFYSIIENTDKKKLIENITAVYLFIKNQQSGSASANVGIQNKLLWL